MVDRNLLREFNVEEAELDSLIAASFPDFAEADIYQEQAQTYDLNQILTGTIVRVDNEEVVVDIGYKSEGVVQRDEWDDADEQPQVGERIEVLLEEFEDSIGLIVLSKRKADRVREWEKIISTHKEGDVVKAIPIDISTGEHLGATSNGERVVVVGIISQNFLGVGAQLDPHGVQCVARRDGDEVAITVAVEITGRNRIRAGAGREALLCGKRSVSIAK